MSLPVAPCTFLGRFERYWASYKKWKVRKGEEIEGRKPSWFTGKAHHTLSAIKSSHARRRSKNSPAIGQMLHLIGKLTKKLFTPRTLEKKPRHFRVSPLPYSRVDQPWHQPSVTQPCSQATSRRANQRSSFEFSSFELVMLISYCQHITTYFGIGFCFSELFRSVCCNVRAYSAVPQI